MKSKYRNGLTNIGLYCGFARDLGNGFIRVQQKSWHRMGLVFALDDGVRGPTHEFEPVTVIFQAIPGRDGEQPTYHALHVTRMGRPHWPRRFTWRNGAWPNDRDFYPFHPDKPGQISDEVNAQLVDEYEWPDWLARATEDDPVLADMLARRHSNNKLPSRLIVTGRVKTERLYTERSPEGYDDLHLRLQLHQPGDAPNEYLSFDMTYLPGFGILARRKYPPGGLPATVVLSPAAKIKPDYVQGDPDPKELAYQELNVVELLGVASVDLAPGMTGQVLFGTGR